MFAYYYSSKGPIDMYMLSITIGVIISLIIQIVLLLVIKKKIKYIVYMCGYFVILIWGKYMAAAVRSINDGALEGKMNLVKATLEVWGTHYLGYVVLFLLLFIPISLFIRELINEFIKVELSSKDEIVEVAEIIAIGLPVQHIFNRIGCLCRGCCYGIKYNGIFSINLPYNSQVDYAVFPCQILEIIGMILIIFVAVYKMIKKKRYYTYIMCGFFITFFISEFFTLNSMSVRHWGLTNIQFMCVGLFIIAILFDYIYLRERE
ncbi:MAG: prolipoprotein diacylglyceryl transferase [Lachnospiraceae bacterium]|nr:prolipoprotein diacylglyceryl transferase [Lachnospiraceae bacterium]